MSQICLTPPGEHSLSSGSKKTEIGKTNRKYRGEKNMDPSSAHRCFDLIANSSWRQKKIENIGNFSYLAYLTYVSPLAQLEGENSRKSVI
jgi:hypothetical protein